MNFIRLVSNSWQSQVECEALPQERIAPAFVLFVTSVIGSASRGLLASQNNLTKLDIGTLNQTKRTISQLKNKYDSILKAADDAAEALK